MNNHVKLSLVLGILFAAAPVLASASPVPPPSLTVTATTSLTVSIAYENLPADTVLVFIKNSDGQVAAGHRVPLADGTGTATIFTTGLSQGLYILDAESLTSTSSVAQSGTFFRPTSPMSAPTKAIYDAGAQTVTVRYTSLPTNTEWVVVDASTTQVVPGFSALVSAGGLGTTTISTAGITLGGYSLRARDATTHAAPTYMSSSVFYVQ